jgi:predicted MFS family arabinose efflux permease
MRRHRDAHGGKCETRGVLRPRSDSVVPTLAAAMLSDIRFRRFWAAQVISEAGSGVGAIAMPLTAVLTLGASSMDMGLLAAASTLPVLLLALHAGVWIDRLPVGPVLVVANLGRGALLGLVPLAAVAGWLRIDVLWCVAFAVGVLTVVFDIATTTYVPSLVQRGQLVNANATLQASGAAARVTGPGMGGWLVQAVGAPLAVTVDALSFVVAAALIARLGRADDFSRPERRGVWTEIGEGMVAVWRDRILRAMVLATTIGAVGGSIQQAAYVLFAVRDVEVSAPVLGTIVACGSLAGMAGAALAGRTARLLTVGGAMAIGQAALALSMFVLLAARSDAFGVVVLGVAQVLFGWGLQTFSVTQISLRQAVTPRHLLGRVNATRRVAVFGIQPVGAVVGGALASAFGLRTALLVAAVIQVVALATILLSPLRDAREASP